jgi:predicted acyltransferase
VSELAASKPQRFVSLDVFRGATMFLMIWSTPQDRARGPMIS